LLPWALCVAGAAAFSCQSQLLTLGTRPVETDAGSAGAGFAGTPTETSGGAGVGGSASGQGGVEAGGEAGNDAAGAAGASAGAGAGAGGDGGGRTIRVIDVSPIAELSVDDFDDENPTLTADLLTIFFISTRGDSADVWTASREAPTALFGAPELVEAASTDGTEASPAISLDGLTLWVGQNRDDGLGGNDIWVYTRSSRDSEDWSAPRNLTALNSSADDIPRQPGFGSLIMPLGSRRDLDGLYHTYLATRSAAGADFGAPVLLSELVFEGRSTVDAFLTADGLMLFYASSLGPEQSDLYVATRASTTAPFGTPVPLADVNTSSDERDPWLSPDGTTLFFAAYHDGDRDLFTAQVIWE
jgi:hypothetical protein